MREVGSSFRKGFGQFFYSAANIKCLFPLLYVGESGGGVVKVKIITRHSDCENEVPL